MTPLAKLGYDTLARELRAGHGPECAWEAAAEAIAEATLELQERVAAIRERELMRADIFEREIQRQIAERTK